MDTALAKPVEGELTTEQKVRNWLAAGYAAYLTQGKSLDQAVKDALSIVAAGAELHIKPFQALRKMYVVHGQVGCAVELMTALAAKSKVVTWQVVEEDEQHCKYRVTRYDTPRPVGYTAEFTMNDAKRMNLIRTAWTDNHGKKHDDNQWVKQPKTMLKKRAASIAFREIIPDIIGGMYEFDDLGIQTTIDPQDWTKAEPIVTDEGLVVDPEVAPPITEDTDQEDIQDGEFTTAAMTEAELKTFWQGVWSVCREFEVTDKRAVGNQVSNAMLAAGMETSDPALLTMDQATVVLQEIRNALSMGDSH